MVDATGVVVTSGGLTGAMTGSFAFMGCGWVSPTGIGNRVMLLPWDDSGGVETLWADPFDLLSIIGKRLDCKSDSNDDFNNFKSISSFFYSNY